MKEKKDNPIFRERGDGLGWTFNFDNKWSYLVLAIFIAAIVFVLCFAFTVKK